MIGIIDVGGGLRGAYTAGIYDYLLDNKIDIDYCLGVSAGSGNLITYVAGQRGRLKRFYLDYFLEKECISFDNYIKKSMYIDLDYIFSEITNSSGKDPLDYDAIMKSDKIFVSATTDAFTGEQCYYTKADIAYDDFTLLKASCAIPVACQKPIKYMGGLHFDGGLSDPIPYRKAFADGCDKLIICLTLPIDYNKSAMPSIPSKILLHKYPRIADKIISSHKEYEKRINEIIALEKQGKVLILYPRECFGIKTATKDKNGLTKLYELGYTDAEKIRAFLTDSD